MTTAVKVRPCVHRTEGDGEAPSAMVFTEGGREWRLAEGIAGTRCATTTSLLSRLVPRKKGMILDLGVVIWIAPPEAYAE